MPRVVPSIIVQVIEKYYPKTKDTPNTKLQIDRGDYNACVSINELLKQMPTELFNPPLVEEHVKLVSNVAILNFILEVWKSGITSSVFRELHGKDEANPISVIHDILLKCTDEAVSTKTSGLEFIDDEIFRDHLRVDLGSVSSTLTNCEWKATTVLAGSITEALLLWAIKKEKLKHPEYKISESLNSMNLGEYNKIAKELNLITEKTSVQVDLVREFRDLIHPGREIRTNAKCTKATAYAGIAAVEFVIDDLTRL